jgi:hypothetical protein
MDVEIPARGSCFEGAKPGFAPRLSAKRRIPMRSSLPVVLLAAFLSFARGAAAQNVQLALDGAADLSPVYPTTKIPANARVFVAIIMFPDQAHHLIDTLMSPVAATGEFTARKQGETQAIAVADKSRVLLRYFFESDLPVGKWRLTVTLDDKPCGATDFDVVPAVAPLKIASPVALAGSLLPGTEWTSAVQLLEEPRPGLKLTLPGVKASADGWLRTTTVRKVVGTDKDGTRIDNYQNGKLTGSSWNLVTDKGIAISKMVADGHTSSADPPELMLASPGAEFHKSWLWHDKKQPPASGHQFQMWGPLPLKTPNGEASGYVMLQKIPNESDPSVIDGSTETGVVPGLGVVYTVGIESIAQYQTATRSESHLTSMKRGAGTEPEVRKDVGTPSK